MDLRNLAAKLSTVDDLNRRVAELEMLVLDLMAKGESEPPAPLREHEVLTLPDVAPSTADWRRDLAARVEDHIVSKIKTWRHTYAAPGTSHPPRQWACPLTASDVAQRLNVDTDEVRIIIKNPRLWKRISWRKMPPASNHPEYGRSQSILHVVTHVDAVPND